MRGWRRPLLTLHHCAVALPLAKPHGARVPCVSGDPSPQFCSQEMTKGDKVRVVVEWNLTVIFLAALGLGGPGSTSEASPVSPTSLQAVSSPHVPHDVVRCPWERMTELGPSPLWRIRGKSETTPPDTRL